jgi:hypothetical protein
MKLDQGGGGGNSSPTRYGQPRSWPTDEDIVEEELRHWLAPAYAKGAAVAVVALLRNKHRLLNGPKP